MTELQERLDDVSRKTLLSCVEWAHVQAGLKTGSMKFAKLDEFNAFIESFNFNDYPAHLLLPFGSKMVFLNGRIKTLMPLQGWIFTRIPQETNDFRSRKVEETYLQPMRKYAKDFFRNLLDCNIIDQEETPVNISIQPEYAFLASGLFGVSYNADIHVLEQVY